MLLGRLFLDALVCSGFYNKVPYIEWLLNNRDLFLIVLEAGNLRSGSLRDWVLARALFWVADSHFLAVSSHGGKGKLALWPLIRTLVLFMKAPSS